MPDWGFVTEQFLPLDVCWEVATLFARGMIRGEYFVEQYCSRVRAVFMIDFRGRQSGCELKYRFPTNPFLHWIWDTPVTLCGASHRQHGLRHKVQRTHKSLENGLSQTLQFK